MDCDRPRPEFCSYAESQLRGRHGALFLVGCHPLDVKNLYAPDSTRALADPAAIEAVADGTRNQNDLLWAEDELRRCCRS